MLIMIVSAAARRPRAGRRGEIFTGLFLELCKEVSGEVRDDGFAAVKFALWKLVHESSEAGVRADGDESEALRLAVHLVLVELNVDEVGDL